MTAASAVEMFGSTAKEENFTEQEYSVHLYGVFYLGNKSKSSELMSGLCDACAVTSHFAVKSKWLVCEQDGLVLRIFLYSFVKPCAADMQVCNINFIVIFFC